MLNRLFIPLFSFGIALLFWQCNGSDQVEYTESDYASFNNIDILGEFKIKLPDYFVEMDDIDPRAKLQYGYIQKDKPEGEQTLEDEIYVTLVEFDKAKAGKEKGDETSLSLADFNKKNMVNQEVSLTEFEVANSAPKTELINGMTCIKNQYWGNMGGYSVFYNMAMFETEDRFYQLLLWCFKDYQDKHSSEMDKIIHSFERHKV